MQISKINKQKQREAYIEALSQLEGEFPKRGQWYTLFDPDNPPPGFTTKQLKSKQAHMLPNKVFTAEELEDIVAHAIHKKIGKFGDKAAALLEHLYEAGLNGDTAAAKEFLNRVLGPVQNQVRFTHDVSDPLAQLLDRMLPSQAYSRPEVDSDGMEIIDVESDELPPGMTEKDDGEETS